MRWTSSRGAILLPNLDDDARRCEASETDENGRPRSDEALARCNDAADGILNGAEDAKDLAPLRVRAWSWAPRDATATVSVEPREKARVFVERDGWFDPLGSGRLSADELRRGVTLGAEARDVIRDARVWDGTVDVELTVRAGSDAATDRVRTRVAPVIFQHDLMPATRVLAAPPSAAASRDATAKGSDAPLPIPRRAAGSMSAFSDALSGASADGSEGTAGGERTARVDASDGMEEYMALFRRGERDFMRDLRDEAGRTRVPEGVQVLREPAGDVWAQDYFEPAYASMPAPRGRQQVVRIMVRSANAVPDGAGGVAMREAGKTVFTELRGPNIGAVQQVDPAWVRRTQGSQDTYNSTGNWGATPPYRLGREDYPNGRIIYGSAPGNRPDPSFVRMMEAQGARAPVALDTSWLLVGHVDEFVSFLPADNRRGWVLAVADPRAGLEVLRDAKRRGGGETEVLAGLKKPEFVLNPDGSVGVNMVPAERTVDEVLGSSAVTDNETFAREIDRNLDILRRELGLERSEIVRVPVLFEDLGEDPSIPPEYRDKAVALLPDAVNGLHLSRGTFLSPVQHGPVIRGRDLMQGAVEESLGRVDVRVRWVEDYYYAHVGGGEVHCVTNALRDISGETRWWSTIR